MGHLGSKLEEIKKDVENQGELTVIFFLPEDEYGYGYTYMADKEYRSFSVQDRFSRHEILNDVDGLIGNENKKAYVGDHQTSFEALKEVIDFWIDKDKGIYDPTLSIEQVIQIGRDFNLDYIIF